MKTLFVAIIVSLSCLIASGQEDAQLIKDIRFYADVVANAVDYDHKVRANVQLVSLIDEALASNIALDFNEINWMPKVSPEDNSFSIISWPVQTAIDQYDYEGYVIKGDKVVKLNDQAAALMDDYKYLIGDKDNWFGQMYYAVEAFQSQGKTKYVLFGLNSFTQYEDIKMADIFYFDENDEPVFGEQLFANDMADLRDAKNRLVLQYSDDSPVNLHFNTGLGVIVFDHLIPRMGQISGQGIIMTGDGSYEAYQLNEGIWLYKEKLFDHIYEEAPRPSPILDGESETSKKDIFGKIKDKN